MQVGITDLLNPYMDRVKVLSLDCFDTLLWRTVASPNDVFYDLAQRPHHQALHITAQQRRRAEADARFQNHVLHGNYETTLHDIYRVGFPTITDEEVQALVNEEIEAEIDHCYAFPPAIQLIQDAMRRGLKIIIVSNTYLEEPQLRQLLQKTLPKDCYEAITRVFCSSEWSMPKHAGLFNIVVKELAIEPQSILHIGDDVVADLEAGKKSGLNALRLVQHDQKIAELLRMQIVAGSIADPNLGYTRGFPSPFRGVYAISGLTTSRPDYFIGYMSIGPILYGFANFILDTVKSIKPEPKVLFVMRDGFLPYLACEALLGKTLGSKIQISSFSALAASFYTKQDVINYLARQLDRWSISSHARQLLLPDEVSLALAKKCEAEKNPKQAFGNEILKEEYLQIIFQNSALYRKRFQRYLEKEGHIKAGDNVLFVDIGYNATAQNLLTPFLKKDMHVKEVMGRYLLANDVPEWSFNRRGFIDASWCDSRVLGMLAVNFTLVEEMFTSGGNSVIDYDEEGNPVYVETKQNKAQLEKIRLIQAECLRFIVDAKKFFAFVGKTLTLETLREVTLAEISRTIFLMTPTEIEYLKDFTHEINKATHAAHALFNPMESNWLRRKGLWFVEQDQRPHALRSEADFEHTIMLMTKRRFGLGIIEDDLSLRREKITAKVITKDDKKELILHARPTHDGFFSMLLYLQADLDKMTINLFFGKNYQWIQFESTELIKAEYFQRKEEELYIQDFWSKLSFKKMTEKGPKLYQCTKDGVMVINPAKLKDNAMLRIVFRPILY